MSADGQMPDAQPAVAEAPQTEAPQVNDALMSRLDEMSQQIQSMSQAQPPAHAEGASLRDHLYAEPEPGYDQFQPDQYDQQFDPNQGYDPYQQQGYEQPGQQFQGNPQQAAQELQQYIASQVQDGIRPFIQQQKADQVEQKYPDIAKDPNKYLDAAAQWANRIGKPELAREPEMIELVYLAQKATQNAAQEMPADGEQGVHLESGGAAPQQEEVDPATRMLQAWKKA